MNERWDRWDICSLCKQGYHGVVACAIGWACWKTYVGRPEGDWPRTSAMNLLGNGLVAAKLCEDALPVREAALSMLRRLGAPEQQILATLSNLASLYHMVGRPEDDLRTQRDVYSGTLKLYGEENRETLREAINLGDSLHSLRRYAEAKALLHKTVPVARRVLGQSHILFLKMRWVYARALYHDDGATLDDLREAAATLEETERTVRRVLGGAHPMLVEVGQSLRHLRAALRARETLAPGSS